MSHKKEEKSIYITWDCGNPTIQEDNTGSGISIDIPQRGKPNPHIRLKFASYEEASQYLEYLSKEVAKLRYKEPEDIASGYDPHYILVTKHGLACVDENEDYWTKHSVHSIATGPLPWEEAKRTKEKSDRTSRYGKYHILELRSKDFYSRY